MKSHSFERQLGARVRNLRRSQGLTLEALAAASNISKSMISLIERGESSPSAGLLDRLATTLGVPLALLFIAEDGEEAASVALRSEQPTWRDPDSGYLRRSLSPPGRRLILLSEVELPAGASVGFANGALLSAVEQQLFILAGELTVEIGKARHHLSAGDCVVMQLDASTRFINLTAELTRYLVAVSGNGPGQRPIGTNVAR